MIQSRWLENEREEITEASSKNGGGETGLVRRWLEKLYRPFVNVKLEFNPSARPGVQRLFQAESMQVILKFYTSPPLPKFCRLLMSEVQHNLILEMSCSRGFWTLSGRSGETRNVESSVELEHSKSETDGPSPWV